MSAKAISHPVVTIGRRNAGIPLAARLHHARMTDFGIIAPSEAHYYQPPLLRTSMFGGCDLPTVYLNLIRTVRA